MQLHFVTLDVRPLILQGEHPKASIMAAVKALSPGHGLRLIAPFQPLPLIQMLQGQGFEASSHPLPGGDWQVDFTRENRAGQSRAVLSLGSSLAAADWPAPQILLDLSGMQAQTALSRLMRAVQRAREGTVLFAVLDGPLSQGDLDRLGQPWAGNHADDGSGYRLLIRRAAA